MINDMSALVQEDGTLIPMDSAEKPKNQLSRKRQKRPFKKSGKVKKRFEMLNNFCDVTMRDLKGTELAVWISLYRHSTNGVSTLAQSRMAEMCGISTRTVQRTLHKLKQKGLVEIVYQGSVGKGMSKYRISSIPLNFGDSAI